MKAITYKIPVQGSSEQECDQKANAIAILAQHPQLNGVILQALAEKFAGILEAPFKRQLIFKELGLA